MAKEKQAGASLNPEDFSEGGGLLDNVDVTWEKCRFMMWDYQGKIQTPVPALCIKMTLEDGDEAEQYWSAGNPKDWAPSQDGTILLPQGTAESINMTSNLGILISSIVNAGFPIEKLEDKISIFDGMRAHMVRQAAPKRSGLATAPRADGRSFDPTILVVDKILSFPWEKGAAKGAGGAKAAAPAADDSAAADLAVETIMGILAETPTMPRTNLASQVFQKLKGSELRNAAVQLVYSDEFITNGPWNYADGNVSIE